MIKKRFFFFFSTFSFSFLASESVGWAFPIAF